LGTPYIYKANNLLHLSERDSVRVSKKDSNGLTVWQAKCWIRVIEHNSRSNIW